MAGSSSVTTLKRIHREIADLQKEDLGPITLSPTDDNLFLWKATIPGPTGSVYEGGVYKIDIVLANDYPFSAPKVTFITRIYHMNISDRGNVCIDILKYNWSPALSLFKVVLSLSSLLTDPNPQDPLVHSIATEYVGNRVQHDKTARQWTELYARPPPSNPPSVPGPSINIPVKPSASSLLPPNGKHKAHAPTTTEPITIDESDTDLQHSEATSVGTTGKEKGKGKGTKRKRKTEVSAVDEDEDQIEIIVDIDQDVGPSRKRSKASGSTSGRRQAGVPLTQRHLGDVIVIDD